MISLGSGATVTNHYLVSFSFPLPSTLAQTNTTFVGIPSYGPATLYPSTVNVAGLSGVVSKTVVTLLGLYHTFPSDVDAVLVNPVGQTVALMANAGYSYGVVGLDLSFDDAAAAPLPEFAPLATGMYKASVYGTLGSLPTPAPGAPYAATLASLNGSSPNGTWSLYVFDHKQGDSGGLTGGWGLSLTTVNPVGAATVGLQIQPGANGNFQLVLNGSPGIIYVLESSADLSSWTPISTNTATAVPSVYVVNPQSASRAFYRAVAQP